MSDNVKPMTPKEEDKNAGVVRLEDGTAYPLDGYIKVETREYHQTTHYLNRQIAVEDIINEFGDLPTFEKGLYFDWSTYHNASDDDKELADKVQQFVDEHDYDREEDCWTMNKGGYDVDTKIVNEFTMETK
jgi:phosphoribosyl 1,2-cyclic phosphodiesterase